MEEGEGFEPPELLHPTVFKTVSISQTLTTLHRKEVLILFILFKE